MKPHSSLPFRDREEAGQRLSEHLSQFAHCEDTLIIGLANGGVPVACQLAKSLGLKAEVLPVSKIAVESNPQYAIGAIAVDGSTVWNDTILAEINLSEDELQDATEMAEARLFRHRGYYCARPNPSFEARRVIVTDDGSATGTTMKAALAALEHYPFQEIVIALPICTNAIRSELEGLASQVVVVAALDSFYSVGLCYDYFPKVDYDHAMNCLQSVQPSRTLARLPERIAV